MSVVTTTVHPTSAARLLVSLSLCTTLGVSVDVSERGLDRGLCVALHQVHACFCPVWQASNGVVLGTVPSTIGGLCVQAGDVLVDANGKERKTVKPAALEKVGLTRCSVVLVSGPTQLTVVLPLRFRSSWPS